MQPPHKVNLNEPDLTVLVQVMKNTCALSIVGKYKSLGKFNLRELAKAGDEEDNSAAKGLAEPAKAASEQLKTVDDLAPASAAGDAVREDD